VIDPDAGLTFLDFVHERHRVWQKRQQGKPQPWTDDPILATRKFTNIFRWLDPGSQFVITDLICENEFEFLSRCLLYRITNLPAAWKAFEGVVDLTNNPVEFRQHLHDYKASGGQVFSGAYMIWGGTEKGVDKIDHVFGVLDGAISGMAEFLLADNQKDRFEALARCRGIGDFNAMQVLTDFGYGTEFRENEFVVLGPGARKGAMALLSGGVGRLDATLEWAHDALTDEWDGPEVAGRHLSKMDVQNCLCEFSKYVRFAAIDKRSPEKPYTPAHPGVQLPPVLPPRWH
jgi:hypothetical protein